MNRIKKVIAASLAALSVSALSASVTYAAEEKEFLISSDDSRYKYIEGTGQTAVIATSEYSQKGFSGSLVIPDVIDGLDVVGIYDNGFTGSEITSVKIPAAVTEIGSLAFANCLNLTDVVIPEGITGMGTMAFSQTPFENELLKNSEGKDFALINNNILYLYTGNSAEITVPEGVSVIAGSAFANNGINSDKDIKSITFSDSTQYVGENVFDGCKNLQKVIFKEGVKEIDDDAFSESFKGVICGYDNSVAQKYAETHNLKFVEISVDGTLLGDANNDGYVNVRDAAYIARALSEGKDSELPKNADFNEDGDVNVRDAASIARFLASGKK